MSFITADQLLVHALGDYVFQSHWMAQEKTRDTAAAFTHALMYSLPFMLFRPSMFALAVIFGTHFLIDRFRLARYVVYFKNCIVPQTSWKPWNDCRSTGYPSDTPAWLAVWLLIIADNVMHVLINGVALKWL